ncbi:cell cycle control protein [Fusarium austroafricanum]|uniref:Cell cycle control protein n=1 Tax=Fusarium austroafricanum TaxID=2364996 RepID=A0A8H4NZG2_9HYPO|nr:cell cycle control protein [Fusarium austroafricanum]
MAENSDDFLEMFEREEDDELTILGNLTRNLQSLPNRDDSSQLWLPNPSAPAAFPPNPPRQHHREHYSRRNQPSSPPQPLEQQQEAAQVIDLTDEPDSPVQSRARLDPIQNEGPAARNPRRTNSQRISPPQLARTDGTFVGRSASVIDLTLDSPEEERPRPRYRRRPPREIFRADELIDLEIISQRPALGGLPNFAALGSFRRLAGIFDIAAFSPPNLDISRNAFARQPSPKPQMSPPPPTRDGFTRDTCTDLEKESESVVICPACSDELAYDPSGMVTQSSVGTSKGKRKRAPGEHHFWAVKKCGHVYCAYCYENRKPTKTNRDGVGFRSPDDRPVYTAAADLRCAVEDCDSKVSAKTEWVGIFL